MASAPWLAYTAVFAQLVPPMAALVRRVFDRARMGIVAWCFTLFLTDAISWWQGHILHQNNLWLEYVGTALSGAVLLWTLSAWQVHSVPQLALRVLTPLYLLAHLTLVLTIEDLDNFSLVTETLNGLLLLSLVLYTLIVRSLDEREHLTRFDWFWVCSGLALYFGCDMAVDPLSRLLLAGGTDLLVTLILTRSVVDMIAMLAIARGLLCPLPPHRSGGSSSPHSSRSLSY